MVAAEAEKIPNNKTSVNKLPISGLILLARYRVGTSTFNMASAFRRIAVDIIAIAAHTSMQPRMEPYFICFKFFDEAPSFDI